jgi:hypothetical protein
VAATARHPLVVLDDVSAALVDFRGAFGHALLDLLRVLEAWRPGLE